MEALRTLSITLVSADNLPDIRKLGRMKVYAGAGVIKSGEVKCTSVDTVFKTSPRWNERLDFTVRDSDIATDEYSNVAICLFCRRHVGSGDKLIGAVALSLKALFDNSLTCSAKPLTFDVVGTKNGKLTISYGFGDKFVGAPPRPQVKSSSGWSKALSWAEAVNKGLEVGMAVLEVVGKVMS